MTSQISMGLAACGSMAWRAAQTPVLWHFQNEPIKTTVPPRHPNPAGLGVAHPAEPPRSALVVPVAIITKVTNESHHFQRRQRRLKTLFFDEPNSHSHAGASRRPPAPPELTLTANPNLYRGRLTLPGGYSRSNKRYSRFNGPVSKKERATINATSSTGRSRASYVSNNLNNKNKPKTLEKS
ncbi:hypothetical protein B0T20DRAFT_164338 [Sordaria brevicollis]|uniref:Uncharacterized protein n=1 Tax=Sordaria brevicollis TaxID=83679 RepID=A0AAE0PJX1_SORBR|nr:hypothetical protein B0T20DRAFT_164338 [Sordaria brevicollis]